MSMRDLLGKLARIDESMKSAEKKPTGPKFPGYWKGTDKASQAKNKMVGGGAEESILKDLEKALIESPTRNLKEEYKRYSSDWCSVCGQSPCNCTHVNEGVVEGAFDDASPMTKDSVKQDKIRSLKNLIAIAKEQGRQLRVQELELELKKLQGVAEGSKKIPASNKPVDPKDMVVSLKDVPVKKPRGHTQYDPAQEFPGVKAFKKQGVAEGTGRSFLEIVDDFLVDYSGSQSGDSYTWTNGKKVIEVEMDPADSGTVYWALGIAGRTGKTNWVESGSDNLKDALRVVKNFAKNSLPEGVAEGVMKDFDIDLQEQHWDAIVGYVVNGLKKGIDIGRMELNLYKWAGEELFDVDQALEEHGFESISDLADHIQDHDGKYVPPTFDLSNLDDDVTEEVAPATNNTTTNNTQTTPGQPTGQVDPKQAQQAKMDQQNLNKNINKLKAAGINVNPVQAQTAFTKADVGAKLNPTEKDTISKLAPAVGDIMANPNLAPQFTNLIQKAQAQSKVQQQQTNTSQTTTQQTTPGQTK